MTTSVATRAFGPFELHEPLGGGMSIVYRARRAGDPRELAVKLLRQERLLDGEARARFARELRAMQELSHQGICPLLEAGEVEGMPYLCMPLLRGRSLAAHLDEARQRGVAVAATLPGPRSDAPAWCRIVEITAGLADALAVAHAHGFVHRDLKPANVWIEERGEPLLLDFGLARDRADRYQHLTHTGQIVGTPTYLAPEQLDARLGPVDAHADVYGLAAVLYETLTLVPPFTGATRAELFANILAGQPPSPRRNQPELPEALAELLEVAMARRPRDRCPTAAALAADLRRVLAGERPAVRRPSCLRRFVRLVRAQPLRVALVSVLLVATWLCAGTIVHLARAAETAPGQQAEADRRVWLGRLVLARNTYARLPPPWPQHRSVLADWLRDHGRPLLSSPEAAQSAVPGLPSFAKHAVTEVENRLVFAATVQARSLDAHTERWAAAVAAIAADPRFAGFVLVPQIGLVPLGADPASHLQEFLDLASGDPALPVPQRDATGRLVLEDRHGIVFVLLPGSRHQPLGSQQEVALAPFLIAKHELTRAQYACLDLGRDPNDVPIGMWNGELQTLRHPVNRLRYFEAQALLQRWGLCLPTQVQWEHAALAGGTNVALAPPGNYSGGEDGFRRSAPVGSYPANDFGLYDMLGNVAEPCADLDGAGKLPARDGDGLRDEAPDVPQRVIRGGSYGSIPWAIAGSAVIEADQRSPTDGARPVRILEQR